MELFGFNTRNDKESRQSLSISVSGVINWFKDRRIKKDLDNIKTYDDFISQSQDQKQNIEEI